MGKIILQDSDPGILDSITTALENEGYNVLPIISAEYILTQIDAFRPHVVLLDFKFNGKDSSMACSMIRYRYPGIPVIALSCNHNIAEEYLKHGFNGYIVKPFDIDHLYTVIELFTSRNLVYAV